MANAGVMIGATYRAARELALTEIIERDSYAGMLTLPAKLSLLDQSPGALVNISSALDGWGRGSKTGRRIGRLANIRITGDKRIIATVEDAHSTQRLGMVEALASSLPNPYGDGAASILPHNGGGGFNGAGFFRPFPSYAWCEQTKRVIEVRSHLMHVERDGLAIEGYTTNYLLHSGFDAGLTGWSTVGTGVNGSSIATDTTRLLFDPAIGPGMPYSILLVAGTPHAAQLSLYQTLASVPANTIVTLCVDTVSYNGVGLDWYLQRGVDGFYFNGATWAAGAVKGGTCSVRTSLQQMPEVLKTINVGGSATTLTFVLGFPTGGTSGRAASVYHAQVGSSGGASWAGGSRVPSFAAAGIRHPVYYGHCNDSGRRSFPAARGTLHLRVTPAWSSSDVVAISAMPFFSVVYGVTDYVHGYYDGAIGKVVFRRATSALGGSVTYALGSYAVTAGVPFYVAFRWASTDGAELDDLYGAAPANKANFDVWAGTPGNLAKLASNNSAPPVESTYSQFRLGGATNMVGALDGRVEIHRLQQRVLNDEEMMKWAF